jgi:hypothetical protein
VQLASDYQEQIAGAVTHVASAGVANFSIVASCSPKRSHKERRHALGFVPHPQEIDRRARRRVPRAHRRSLRPPLTVLTDVPRGSAIAPQRLVRL